jgi:hypothetical protein
MFQPPGQQEAYLLKQGKVVLSDNDDVHVTAKKFAHCTGLILMHVQLCFVKFY